MEFNMMKGFETMKGFELIKGFEEFQKLNQQSIEASMKLMGEWNKGWQAIAAEMTDYTRRSYEEFDSDVGKADVRQVARPGFRDPVELRQARL